MDRSPSTMTKTPAGLWHGLWDKYRSDQGRLRNQRYITYKLISTLACVRSFASIYTVILFSYFYNHIMLVPVHGIGNIQHYYHFIVNAALPMSVITKYKRKRSTISFPDFGIFSPYLSLILNDNTTIQTTKSPDLRIKTITLHGLNPLTKNVPSATIQHFRNTVLNNLDIQEGTKKRVLFIERAAPHTFFSTEAERKESGSTRRSIVNSNDFYEMLRERLHADYELLKVQLEHIPFKEQVTLFHTSVGVVGQHGAGLVNMIWMPSGSFVIEIGHGERAHFEVLSGLSHVVYFRYDCNQRHAEINKSHFVSWLERNKGLQDYFLFS